MYILDTHVLLWYFENNPCLKPKVHQLITDPNNLVYVSTVTVWEIVIKKMLGKLIVPDNLADTIELTGFKPLNITFKDALMVESLPRIHNDPFDRLLIAQAKVHGLTLITHDTHCIKYPLKTINPIQAEIDNKWTPFLEE